MDININIDIFRILNKNIIYFVGKQLHTIFIESLIIKKILIIEIKY
jgi:hypothetical protein